MGLRYKVLGGFAVAAAAGLLALFSGADVATGLIASAARNYLSRQEAFRVSFQELQGNPVVGYRVSGLEIGLADGSPVVTVQSLSVGLSARTFSAFKPVLWGQAQGLRVQEPLVVGLISALTEAFSSPEAQEPSEPSPLPVAIDRVSLTDFGSMGGLPWRMEEARAELRDSRQGVYGLTLMGAWEEIPVALEGSLAVQDTFRGLDWLDLTLRALEGQLSLAGELQEELRLQLSGLDLGRVGALIPQAPVGLGGTAAAELLILDPLGDLSVQGRAGLQGLRCLGLEIGHLSLPVDYRLGLVTLEGIEGTLFAAPVEGSFSIDLLDPQMPLGARLRMAQLDLEALGSRRLLPDLASGGLQELELDFHGPLKALQGRGSLSGGSLAWRGHQVTELQLQLVLEGQAAALDLEGRWMDNPLSASARLNLTGPREIAASLSAPRLDLASLAKAEASLKDLGLQGDLALSLQAEGSLENPSIKVTAQSPGISAAGQKVEAMELDLTADLDELVLERLRLSWMGGKVDLSGSLSNYRGGKPDGAFHFRLEGLRSAALGQAFPALEWLDFSSHNALDLKIKVAQGIPSASVHGVVGSLSAAGALLAGNFRLAGELGPKALKLTSLSAQVPGGTLKAEGALDWTDLEDPRIDLQGVLENLDLAQALEGLEVPLTGQVTVRFGLAGSLKDPRLDVEARSPQVRILSLGLKDLVLSLKSAQDRRVKLSLKGFNEMGGLLEGGGSIALAGQSSSGDLDLKITFNDLDLRNALPQGLPLSGTVSLSLSAAGTLQAPQVQFRIWGPKVALSSYALEAPEIAGQFQGRQIDLKASVDLGGCRPEVTGLVTLGPPWKVEFQGAAGGLDPVALDPALEGLLEGSLGFSLSGALAADQPLELEARVFSPSVGVRQLRIRDLEIPLQISQGRLTVDGGRGQFCGGVLSLSADGDLAARQYNSNLSLLGVQMDQFLEPLEIPGSMSGTADLTVDGRVQGGMTVLANLAGKLKLEGLEIKDVPYVKLLTAGAPLRVREALISFSADPDEFFIMPGSTAAAWPDDPLFRYVAVSGSLWRRPVPENAQLPQEIMADRRDPLQLDISGNINVRALNGLLQGVGVLLQSSIEGASGKEMATDFLKGLIGGAKNQFRDIFFRVAGSYDRIQIQDIQVENEIQIYNPDNSWTSSKSTKKDDEPNYKFQFRIPVGPGAGKGDSVGKQATGQILGNIVEGLVGGNGN